VGGTLIGLHLTFPSTMHNQTMAGRQSSRMSLPLPVERNML
jgi:hypothetical protein